MREAFCEEVSLAEEFVPLSILRAFFLRHEAYARLACEHPHAFVFVDSLPWSLVEAYRNFFQDQELPDTASGCIGSFKVLPLAEEVARTALSIAHPAACSEACVVIAYAMLRCEALFRRHCWYQSLTLPSALQVKYPTVDFFFSG